MNWQATSSQTYKLSEWNPFSDEASSWFDPEWMFGIKNPSPLVGEGKGEGGFDIVIANPPYMRIQIMKESAAIEAKYLKENYIAARKGNYDIYVVFLELGMRLLNKMGELSFIESLVISLILVAFSLAVYQAATASFPLLVRFLFVMQSSNS